MHTKEYETRCLMNKAFRCLVMFGYSKSCLSISFMIYVILLMQFCFPEEITISEEKPHTEDTDAEYTDVALSNMRRTIAKRVTESKMTVPHVYTTLDCNLDKVFIMRKKLKEDGIVVSVNDFIIKAAGIALIRVPEVNSYWSEDGPVPLKTVDIGVAVASPNGLITPVINGANELDIPSISLTVRVS